MEKVLSRKSVQIHKSLIFLAIRAAVSKGGAAPSLTMNERPKLESENRHRSGRDWVLRTSLLAVANVHRIRFFSERTFATAR